MPAIDESPLQFPCSFPIKAMGWHADDFDALVVGIVRKHAPDLMDTGIEKRHSRGGRYISITVTIQAQSREQLDNIYRDLAANGRVLVAL
ncbi:MAG: YbeD family protein [Gammaproteobacteria bacterium]